MIGGIGVQELLIIFFIALILFGGKKLPEVGRNLGKAIRGFKDAEEETRRELSEAARSAESKKAAEHKGAAGTAADSGEEEPQQGDEDTEEETVQEKTA